MIFFRIKFKIKYAYNRFTNPLDDDDDNRFPLKKRGKYFFLSLFLYRRACVIRCMNADKTRGVCKDRSRRRSVVSAYLHGKKA